MLIVVAVSGRDRLSRVVEGTGPRTPQQPDAWDDGHVVRGLKVLNPAPRVGERYTICTLLIRAATHLPSHPRHAANLPAAVY